MTPTASVNWRAWARPFWPVVASSTRRTSSDLAALALQDPAELAQLLHQVGLGVEAAGGVDQEHVGAPGPGRGQAVEGDRGRVGALLVADHRGADAVGPDGQLLGGGGPEGVGGGQHRLLALLGQGQGQLAHGGGLAGAVDADDQHDPWSLLVGEQVEGEGPVRGADGVQQLGPEQLAQGRAAGPLGPGPGPQALDQLAGGGHADVGRQQGLFQLLPGLVVVGAPGQQAGHAAGQGGPGAAEALAEAAPGGDDLLGGRRGHGGDAAVVGREVDVGDLPAGRRGLPGVVANPRLAVQVDRAGPVGVLAPAAAGDQRHDGQQAQDHQGGGDHEEDLQPFHYLTSMRRLWRSRRAARPLAS